MAGQISAKAVFFTKVLLALALAVLHASMPFFYRNPLWLGAIRVLTVWFEHEDEVELPDEMPGISMGMDTL